MQDQTPTFEEIAAAASALRDDGNPVTVEAVRDALGSGSPSTIHKHLAAWRADNIPSPETPKAEIPEPLAAALADWAPVLKDGGHELEYVFEAGQERTGIAGLLRAIGDAGIAYKDINTRQSSLEDIFVGLLHGEGQPARAQDVAA